MSLNNYRVLVTQTREAVVTVTAEDEDRALGRAEALTFDDPSFHGVDDAGVKLTWYEVDRDMGLTIEKLDNNKWSDE